MQTFVAIITICYLVDSVLAWLVVSTLWVFYTYPAELGWITLLPETVIAVALALFIRAWQGRLPYVLQIGIESLRGTTIALVFVFGAMAIYPETVSGNDFPVGRILALLIICMLVAGFQFVDIKFGVGGGPMSGTSSGRIAALGIILSGAIVIDVLFVQLWTANVALIVLLVSVLLLYGIVMGINFAWAEAAHAHNI